MHVLFGVFDFWVIAEPPFEEINTTSANPNRPKSKMAESILPSIYMRFLRPFNHTENYDALAAPLSERLLVEAENNSVRINPNT